MERTEWTRTTFAWVERYWFLRGVWLFNVRWHLPNGRITRWH
jgi:hypothetical protein